MAAVMTTFRCERLFWFLRLFNESAHSLSQVITTTSKFSTSTCNLYCKTLPLLAKKWNVVETTHDFAKPAKTLSRDDLPTRSQSKNIYFNRDEEDFDSESEEEEEIVESKSHKLKKGAKWQLRQKSSKTTILRPSKYLFRDRKDWNKEQQWEGREIPEDFKRKAGWYARQMSRFSHEGEVRDLSLCADQFETSTSPPGQTPGI